MATRNSRALINIDPGGVCALETSPNAFISVVIEKVLTGESSAESHKKGLNWTKGGSGAAYANPSTRFYPTLGNSPRNGGYRGRRADIVLRTSVSAR